MLFAKRPQRRASLLEGFELRTLFSTFVVNNAFDDPGLTPGVTTLRQAIAMANNNAGPDTITFDPVVFPAASANTITLTSGQLKLTDASGTTSIVGPGSAALTVEQSADNYVKCRVLRITPGALANISGLTISGGDVFVPSGGL